MKAGTAETLPFLFLVYMKNFFFIFLCVIWFADMAALVALAPLDKHVLWFSVLYCLGHILMILIVLKFPANLRPLRSWVIVWALAIAVRLLFLPYPVGNDIFRYIWEGYIQNQGFNPFIYSPLNPALQEIARGGLYPVWQQINHPEFSAAYPPATLLLFRILAGLNQSPLFFKLAMTVFDIGVMVLLMVMISRLGISPSRLLLYAANPLVLIYISGEGHMDIVQVFFLFLALYLILFQKLEFTGFLMLGVAVLCKYFAFIAWPFLLNAENRWKSLSVFIPLILFIPFIDAGAGMFESLATFAINFHYNDSIVEIIRLLFGGRYLVVGAFLLMLCLAWVYLAVHNRLRSVYLALGFLLIFLPTLHPWYLVLIAPFLVFFPSRAWLYFLASVVFTFPVTAFEAKTGVFQEIFQLKFLEYIPFYALLIWGIFREGYLLRDRTYLKPTDVSVVIPALNEEHNIGSCLASLKDRPALKEIIVADGGSTDKTKSVAAEYKVRVIESVQGRGGQIKAGVKSASGDVILILHADCVAAEDVFERVIKSLEANPHVVGGAFGMQFNPNTLKTRFIAFLNNFRAILTGISFGDQAQFFRVAALNEMGGFPSMMLMEDVDLSLRLKEVGRMIFLPDGIVVSDRRWNGSRIAGKLRTVFYLFTRYLIERRWGKVDRSMRNYYEIYYN